MSQYYQNPRNYYQQRERFEDPPAAEQPTWWTKSQEKLGLTLFWTIVVIIIIFYVLFGAFAAYLSFASNSIVGWNIYWKVFFSFCAFFIGNVNYIVTYLIHKLDLILIVNKLQGKSSFTLM
jgi:hypothetical protein